MTRFAGRTANGVPRQARDLAENPRLRVDGLVGQPRLLTVNEISALAHERYLDGLAASDDGLLPRTDWVGVRLSDLIALVEPAAAACFIRVSGGPYGAPVERAEADRVLICDRIGDDPLTPEQGGPWRLVMTGVRYFKSVKWVDHIELTKELPDDSALRIAKARARARDAKAARSPETAS